MPHDQSTSSKALPTSVEQTDAVLWEAARSGARRMLQAAMEAEIEAPVAQHQDIRDGDGRRMVVGNGHAPCRTIPTGVGAWRCRGLGRVSGPLVSGIRTTDGSRSAAAGVFDHEGSTLPGAQGGERVGQATEVHSGSGEDGDPRHLPGSKPGTRRWLPSRTSATPTGTRTRRRSTAWSRTGRRRSRSTSHPPPTGRTSDRPP